MGFRAFSSRVATRSNPAAVPNTESGEAAQGKPLKDAYQGFRTATLARRADADSTSSTARRRNTASAAVRNPCLKAHHHAAAYTIHPCNDHHDHQPAQCNGALFKDCRGNVQFGNTLF